MARTCLAVDARVVVKWLLPEPGRDRALLIRDLYQAEKLDLIAPYLLVSEVGNVLWRRIRVSELTRISHRLTVEARDRRAIPSMRLLGTIGRHRVAAMDRQDCRSLRRAHRTDGPLTHFVSPRGEKCRLAGLGRG